MDFVETLYADRACSEGVQCARTITLPFNLSLEPEWIKLKKRLLETSIKCHANSWLSKLEHNKHRVGSKRPIYYFKSKKTTINAIDGSFRPRICNAVFLCFTCVLLNLFVMQIRYLSVNNVGIKNKMLTFVKVIELLIWFQTW